MTDWSKCQAVESVPGKVSGADPDTWVFKDTRLPLYVLFENLAEGATIYDFIDWFGGVEESEVKAVLEHVAQDLRARHRRCASCSITGPPGNCAAGSSDILSKQPRSAAGTG